SLPRSPRRADAPGWSCPRRAASRPRDKPRLLPLRGGRRTARRDMSATVHPIGAARAPSLEPMIHLVAADLNHVNAVILERMQSEVSLIPELAGHLIAGGGKRMRPMLTLACARLLDYQGTRHHKLAAAIEFI